MKTYRTILLLLCGLCFHAVGISVDEFSQLCGKAESAAVIQAQLDSGIDLRPAPEEDDSNSPLVPLFLNDRLSTEEKIQLGQRVLDAGDVMTGDVFWSACNTDNKELIDFCLQHGAKVDEGRAFATPLTCHCLYEPNRYVSELEAEEDEPSPEQYAEAERQQKQFDQKRQETIRYLIELGADINGKGASPDSPSPLNFASIRGDIAVMNLLIEHGADVNRAPACGFSPLHDACAGFAGLDAVRVLVEHGANVNHVSDFDTTALMSACLTRKVDVVRYLLEQGADASLWSRYISSSELDLPDDLFAPFELPALPTLAYCFWPDNYSFFHNEFTWEIPWMIFKAQSIWAQAAYILALLTLIALPILAIWILYILIRRIIRLIKRKKTQS